MKTAVLITVFNEEKNIGKVIRNIDTKYDVYIVDDGSTDNTVKAVKKLGAFVIKLPLNLGQGSATISGYKLLLQKDYDVIVKLDGDGQHDPHEIEHLIDKMEKSNLDLVVGSRILGTNYIDAPFLRKTFLPLYTRIINFLSGYNLTDCMCGFRAFRVESLKKVVHIFDTMLEPQYIAAEMFLRFSRAGFTAGEVPIHLLERNSGASYKGTLRYGYGVLRAIIRTYLDKKYWSISSK